MNFKSKNNYKVYFKDGTTLKGNGNSSGIEKSTVDDEFKWIAFHIQREVRQSGRKLKDIEKIKYVLEYST